MVSPPLDPEGDGLASEGLHEDPVASAQLHSQVQCVVLQGAAILNPAACLQRSDAADLEG